MADASDVVLGGYPAKWCPRRTHNDFSPNSPKPIAVSVELQSLFDGGLYFERDVTTEMAEALGGRMTFIDGESDWEVAIADTLSAIGRGDEVIVNGRLPSAGRRAGAPDVLIRVPGGYLPVDIKHHHTRKATRTKTIVYSSLSAPSQLVPLDGFGAGSHRVDDALQLAHYTRMLQELGCHPANEGHTDDGLWGGIIGTDDYIAITGHPHGITWYRLDGPLEQTFSASSTNHRATRTAMERYDHEFAFRVDIASAAREGRELVRPIGVEECGSCKWLDYCTDVAGDGDVSFLVSAPSLTAREWLFLRDRGGATIAGLADLDVDSIAAEFTQHAVNRKTPQDRLRNVVTQARLHRDGIVIEPTHAWVPPPTADIEIDFDLEWGRDGRIYQWGIRLRDNHDDTTARYEPVISFEALDDEHEAALATEFANRLNSIITAADDAKQTLTIFHWTHPEISRTRKFHAVAAALADRTFDLHGWFTNHYTVRGSTSLKNVAAHCGFVWAVDDPGGFASMNMIEQARTPGDDGEPAREWCLAYNESDVAAQAAVRDALRNSAPIGRLPTRYDKTTQG